MDRRKRDVKKDYFLWLMEQICFDRDCYLELMTFLYETDFRYILHRDESRAVDGICLRDDFESFSGERVSGKPCSVLEMLIALSIRIDTEYISDLNDEQKAGKIFWEMIKNLRLDIFTDRHWNEQTVSEILDLWMERRFRSDGKGSIFPLKYSEKDQKNVEIWQQMLQYLDENY